MENNINENEKQSEITDQSSSASAVDTFIAPKEESVLSQETTVTTSAETKQTKKRGRKPKVESEETAEESTESKKPRKPFVYTDKRKEAFERCRQARAEAIKRKQEELAAVKESKSEVRTALKEIRKLPVDLSNPKVVDILTCLHEHVNMPIRKQAELLREQQIEAKVMEKVELTQAVAPNLSQRPESMEAHLPTPPPIDKKRKAVEFNVTEEKEESEDEVDDQSENIAIPPQSETNDDDEDMIDEDTLAKLIELAKQRKQGKSIQRPPQSTFETRRVDTKAPRPNHADAFLQHTQFHHTNFEPSAAVRKGNGPSNFIWM